MKFPSFIRLPRNKHFQIQPRYYDPIKEDIEERTAMIKREMQEKREGAYMPGRISFERKSAVAKGSSFMQILIAAVLGISVFGWLEFGNDILYALLIVIPIYLFIRLKKSAGRNTR